MNKFSLVLLAFFLPVATSHGDTPEQQFLKRVYANGGKTLYCQEVFQPGDRVSIEHIYDERRLAQHFDCRTSRLCQSNPQFVDVSRDRHSLFPVTRRAELDRRRTLFGDLPATTATDGQCGYKQAFQVFEPPKSAKGDVARAMLYLYDRYDIPLLGTLEMYQRWHRDDPVDDEERRRNNVIEQVQATAIPSSTNRIAQSPCRAARR